MAASSRDDGPDLGSDEGLERAMVELGEIVDGAAREPWLLVTVSRPSSRSSDEGLDLDLDPRPPAATGDEPRTPQ